MSIFKKKPEDKPLSPDNFIKASMEGMRGQQSINTSTWHLDKASWDVDMNKGQIRFTLPDKIAVAPVQIVGTLFNGEFMWGWEHPSVPEPLREHALAAKVWGKENGLSKYTELTVKATEDEAWEFTAVASRLGKATGVYRGDMGGTLVFMTFGKVSISKS